MSDRKECCRNCAHLRRLWWWKKYPEEKQDGWCCTLFNNANDEYVVMQLYGDLNTDQCECYSEGNIIWTE